MANIVKCGSLYLDGHAMAAGQNYIPDQEITIRDEVPQCELFWVVANGLLIADRCILFNISWETLNQQDLVFGKPVSIGGIRYTCRLLKVGNKKEIPNEWDAALDAVGTDSDDLWHWKDMLFWGQETPDVYPLGRVYRGYHSARLWSLNAFDNRKSYVGFRPVLEPGKTNPDQIECCDGVTIWCGQSVLKGHLAEKTLYDWVVEPDQTSIVSDSDLNHLIVQLPDGRFVVDRSKITAAQVLST